MLSGCDTCTAAHSILFPMHPSLQLDAGASAKALVEEAGADPRLPPLLGKLNQHLARLHAALPPGGAMIVCSGCGDSPLVRALLGETISACREAWTARNLRRQASSAVPEVQALMVRAYKGVVACG